MTRTHSLVAGWGQAHFTWLSSDLVGLPHGNRHTCRYHLRWAHHTYSTMPLTQRWRYGATPTALHTRDRT